MTRVHMYGASGYAALEAIRLVLMHPALELGAIESASHAGQPVANHAASLRRCDRVFDGEGSVARAIAPGDCVITAGSHGTARTVVPHFLNLGARVIDLSADYRFDSAAVYGFATLYRDAIAQARLVANPGCYPTASLLATLPLAALSPHTIVIDAKSGITGAGRTPATGSLYAEVAGGVRAYGLQGHRHEAEIEQHWKACGIDATLVFTPHVVPLARGMLVDAYAVLGATIDTQEVRAMFAAYYRGDAFVRIVDDAPSVCGVTGTNDAEIFVSAKENVVRAICAIDNLGKGAAAQAIANLNIMYGYPEASGLATAFIPC